MVPPSVQPLGKEARTRSPMEWIGRHSAVIEIDCTSKARLSLRIEDEVVNVPLLHVICVVSVAGVEITPLVEVLVGVKSVDQIIYVFVGGLKSSMVIMSNETTAQINIIVGRFRQVLNIIGLEDLTKGVNNQSDLSWSAKSHDSKSKSNL